jgi:hypothetical protein
MYTHICKYVCVWFFSCKRMSLFITLCVCVMSKKTKENMLAAYEQNKNLFECGVGKYLIIIIFKENELVAYVQSHDSSI